MAHLALLLLGLASAHWLHLVSANDVLLRGAAFSKGIITTSRSLLLDGSHALARSTGRALVETSSKLYVLGLPAEQQDIVHESLMKSGSHMLHALPGTDLHWLVLSDAAKMNNLLQQHQHLTAAPFPDTFKLSAVVEELVAISRLPTTIEKSNTPEHLWPYLSGGPGTPARVVIVALGAHSRIDTLTSLATNLETHLRTAAITSPGCPAHDLGRMAGLLAAESELTWLDLMPEVVLHELYSNAILQARGLLGNTSYPPPSLYGGKNLPYFPYWAAGLDGQGEIVGVVDSGVDLDSCLLWDPTQTDYASGSRTTVIPPATALNTYADAFQNLTVYLDTSARKVVMYSFSAQSDGLDTKEGHGTHVVTSLVGNVYGNQDPTNSPDITTGIVPNAKVAFHDVGKTLPDGSGNGSRLDLNRLTLTGVVNKMRQLGAGVVSNSWTLNQAAATDYVSPMCTILNMLSYDLDDVLLVFGAGNDGRNQSRLAIGTIGGGAVCANVVAVGATENFDFRGLNGAKLNLSQEGVVSRPAPEDFVPYPDIEHGQVTTKFGDIAFRPVKLFIFQKTGTDSSWWPMQGRSLPLLLANPPDACQPVTIPNTPASGDDFIVLIVRSTACTIDQAFQNAFTVGNSAGALVLYYNMTGISQLNELVQDFNLTYPSAFDRWPFGAVYFPDATEGANAVQAVSTGNVTITWSADTLKAAPPPIQNIAEFSSYGASAAFDASRTDRLFRIKPDVVAPGIILAGTSDGVYSGQMDQCTSQIKSGTSMATPQVSGAAVIARQYFLKGFYPTGAAGGKGFAPANTLLRAVLVAGAQRLTGRSKSSKTTLDPPPSQFQGFGAASLGNSLPLRSDISNGRRIQIIHNASFVKMGDTHVYNITLDSAPNATLVVAMAFNDLPSYPGAAASSVNDLDLSVEGPAQTASGTGAWFPNGLIKPDPVNNIERIVIRPAAAGNYRVSVKATFLSANASAISYGLKHTYSLVILGPVSNTIASPYNPASDLYTAPAPTPRSVDTPSSPSSSASKSAADRQRPVPVHHLVTLVLGVLLLCVL